MTLSLQMVEELVWKASPILIVLLLIRLSRAGILLQYRMLSLYLAFSAARSAVLIAVSRSNSPLYAEIYVQSTPILWILSILVALEIYARVLQGYRGLSVLTRRTLITVLLISGIGSVLFVAAGSGFNWRVDEYPVLKAVFAFEQAVALSLFFFLLIMALFLLWYPIPLKRNLIAYSFGYSAILFTFAAGVGLRNWQGHEWTRSVSALIMVIYLCCLVAWLILLNATGEVEVRTAAIPRGEAEEQRLLEQLNSLNAVLEAGRKS